MQKVNLSEKPAQLSDQGIIAQARAAVEASCAGSQLDDAHVCSAHMRRAKRASLDF